MDFEPEDLSNYGREEDERIVGRPYNDLPRPRIIRRQSFLREVIETLLLVIAIYTLVNLSTARFVVEGSSMEPNFHTDEFIIVSRLAYIIGEPERGDVVVFHHYEHSERKDFIKRLVGLPGETVSFTDGRVYVDGQILDEPYVKDYCRASVCNNKAWTLAEDEYFVLGDNRNSSRDSYDFGPIEREDVIGRAWIRYWPPEQWDIVPHHEYDMSVEPPETPEPTPIPTAMPEPEVPVDPADSIPVT